jgi:hypothetical protein
MQLLGYGKVLLTTMFLNLLRDFISLSENIAIAHFLMVSLSSYCWPAVRGVAYVIAGS